MELQPSHVYMTAFEERPIVMLTRNYYVILERPTSVTGQQFATITFQNDSPQTRNYSITMIDPGRNDVQIGGYGVGTVILHPGETHTYLTGFRITNPPHETPRTSTAIFKKFKAVIKTWVQGHDCVACVNMLGVGRVCTMCNNVINGKIVIFNLAIPDSVQRDYTIFYTIV